MTESLASATVRRVVPWLILAIVVVAVLRLAASGRLEPADFTFNNGTEVTTLDPATVTGVPEGRIVRAIFEGLVIKHPKTLEPVPGMAESWEISADGLVYTFRIRQGARWTNGDPVTAEDFVFSFERFLNASTGAEYAYQLWYVKGARAYTTEIETVVDEDGVEKVQPKNPWSSVGITAPDLHTLRIELESPTPFFMDLMGFYPLFPVNRRNIEEAQKEFPKTWVYEWLRPERLVTNGPYRVAFRRVNDRIRLVKNPDYWDADNVAFESIDALAIEQWTTGLNAYLTGSSFWETNLPATSIPKLMGREDFNPRPYLGTYFYRVNVTQPPFDDLRVRRALSLTVNRREICEKIMKAGQVPAYSLVPPGCGNYQAAETQTEDLALARQLMEEAGYGPENPFPTIEIHYNTSETHRDIAEYIGSTWQRELGIRVKYLNQEWKVYLDTQNNINYQVSRSAWIGDYVDANTFLDMFVTGGENNKTGWGHPDYDKYIREAAAELDPERRLAILQRAEEILMEELPIIPIYYYVAQNIVAPRLGGFFHNIQDEHFPKFWYWMNDEELAQRRATETKGLRRTEWDVPFPDGLYSPASGRGTRR